MGKYKAQETPYIPMVLSLEPFSPTTCGTYAITTIRLSTPRDTPIDFINRIDKQIIDLLLTALTFKYIPSAFYLAVIYASNTYPEHNYKKAYLFAKIGSHLGSTMCKDLLSNSALYNPFSVNSILNVDSDTPTTTVIQPIIQNIQSVKDKKSLVDKLDEAIAIIEQAASHYKRNDYKYLTNEIVEAHYEPFLEIIGSCNEHINSCCTMM